MSTISTYFSDFLSNIRLPDELRKELQDAHKELREFLKSDSITADLMVDSFLQGSYARSTCIKPAAGDKVDVDVIAVTNINHESTNPGDAFSQVMPFVEKYYDDFQQQRRSIGISLAKVDVDLVITAAPSEEVMQEIRSANLSGAFTIDDLNVRRAPVYRADSLYDFFRSDGAEKKWRTEPLLIPDIEDNQWHKTHPLEQIRWTRDKNQRCNGHYVNVVKAIKWWKRINLPAVKHPKSYPLEHFVGLCCPDDINSVAEGITYVFERIVRSYPTKPFLPDHGVPEHDVFESLSEEEYQTFYHTVKKFAPIARTALDSNNVGESVKLWRRFFGNCNEFPEYHGPSTGNGFTPRTQKAESVPTGRFG